MSEITKEEILAFTEAHKQTALALEHIARGLEDIVTKQDKVLDKLSNGFAKDISDVKIASGQIMSTCSGISKDTNLMRWASAILVTAIISFEIFARFFMHTVTVK